MIFQIYLGKILSRKENCDDGKFENIYTRLVRLRDPSEF